MDTGDTLELRMTDGEDIKWITLNIELVGLGFDLNANDNKNCNFCC